MRIELVQVKSCCHSSSWPGSSASISPRGTNLRLCTSFSFGPSLWPGHCCPCQSPQSLKRHSDSASEPTSLALSLLLKAFVLCLSTLASLPSLLFSSPSSQDRTHPTTSNGWRSGRWRRLWTFTPRFWWPSRWPCPPSILLSQRTGISNLPARIPRRTCSLPGCASPSRQRPAPTPLVLTPVFPWTFLSMSPVSTPMSFSSFWSRSWGCLSLLWFALTGLHEQEA